MKELYLQYVDEDGEEQNVLVEGDEFIVGRHSESSLMIPNAKLSREHIKIQRFGDVFTIIDLESSNGTSLNGDELDEPAGIEDGDVIDLGGGVEMTAVFDTGEADDDEEAAATPPPPAPSPTQESSKSGIGLVLILAPLLGLFALLVIVGVFIAFSGGDTEVAGRETGQDLYRSTPVEQSADDTPLPTPAPTFNVDVSPQVTPIVDSTPGTSVPTPDATETPTDSADRKTETLVYSFMKRIASNDKRPFLRNSRIKEVEARIASFKGSRALAANISSASSNASALKTTAQANNLQPQFLAVAALARIGNRSGNVTETANTMSGVLDKLTIVLGNELADDSLLVIAAYDEGVAGNTLRMRDRIAGMAKRNATSSPREIRSIWFLREKGELSATQYNLALNFLAIGTITQNPKEFGVNTEPLKLN